MENFESNENQKDSDLARERNRLYNDAINRVEQLISSTEDLGKSTRLGRIHLDLMREWDLELHSSK